MKQTNTTILEATSDKSAFQDLPTAGRHYDALVGQRIKELRKIKKLTQKDIANVLGVSFQQVQKYEKGVDRISFQRIYDLAQYMRVSLESFLTLYEQQTQNGGLSDNSQAPLTPENDSFSQKETDELLSIYYSLDNPKLRKDLLKFIKSMAQSLQE